MPILGSFCGGRRHRGSSSTGAPVSRPVITPRQTGRSLSWRSSPWVAAWLLNAAPLSVADLQPSSGDFSAEPKGWVFNVPGQVGGTSRASGSWRR
jgi:hypothetical protein